MTITQDDNAKKDFEVFCESFRTNLTFLRMRLASLEEMVTIMEQELEALVETQRESLELLKASADQRAGARPSVF